MPKWEKSTKLVSSREREAHGGPAGADRGVLYATSRCAEGHHLAGDPDASGHASKRGTSLTLRLLCRWVFVRALAFPLPSFSRTYLSDSRPPCTMDRLEPTGWTDCSSLAPRPRDTSHVRWTGSSRMRTGIRLLVAAVTLGLATGIACAQSSKDVLRIGILGLDRPNLSSEFLQSLRELGYVEGQNIVFEPRFHYGDDRRLPSFAAELVRLRVNVIVALSGVAVRAAMAATSNVPIVGMFAGDPEARQFVRNLERPGGNVTGIYLLTSQFGGKWLELITEAVPTTRRVA